MFLFFFTLSLLFIAGCFYFFLLSLLKMISLALSVPLLFLSIFLFLLCLNYRNKLKRPFHN